MHIKLNHIIYSLIPYKGYGVRAWSNKEIVSEIEYAFKGWFSPYEQAIVKPGYELRAITETIRDYLYIARIFIGEKLDELKRSGIVSHIVAIPVKLLNEIKLSLEQVDKAMQNYIASRGVGEGDIESIELEVEPLKDQLDPEIDYFRKTVSIDQARKMLTGISKPYGKVVVLYERDLWSRIKLAYSIAKILSIHGLKNYIILVDKPVDNIMIEYENVVLVLSKLIPLKWIDDWSVVKIVSDKMKRGELSIEETLRKIYESDAHHSTSSQA